MSQFRRRDALRQLVKTSREQVDHGDAREYIGAHAISAALNADHLGHLPLATCEDLD